MAKYQKTLDIWKITDEILSGEIVLQSGQWITCGSDGIKSRYIGTNGRSIDACHGGDTKQVTARYKERVKYAKLAKLPRADRIAAIAALHCTPTEKAPKKASVGPTVQDTIRDIRRKYFERGAK